MTSRGLKIKFMSGADSILEACLEILEQFCFILAFKQKQIFYSKLLIFAPAQPESFILHPCE